MVVYEISTMTDKFFRTPNVQMIDWDCSLAVMANRLVLSEIEVSNAQRRASTFKGV